MSVVDNLNKGAAGGAVQWMNRLLGLRNHRTHGPRGRLDLKYP
jgi:N-acetyl-gamma-glutamylphosphate reductase